MKNTIIPADVNQKLDGCVFRYKGVPYMVRAGGGGAQVTLYELTNPHKIYAQIKYNDPDLDISSVPLGYVNRVMFDDVSYLIRNPIRRVKQGVNEQNTKVVPLPGRPRLVNVHNFIWSQGFIDAVTNKFPPLDVALKSLRQRLNVVNMQEIRYQSMAISRDIALMIDEMGIITVFYKNNYVGWIQPNKDIVHVKSNELGWVVSRYLSHILGWVID